MISFDNVSRRYRSLAGREVHALTDFSLEILRGEIFGLAGPNGAGKSTLINLLLGFLGPSAGTVQIDGQDPRRYVERHGAGYLSELINIPAGWTVRSALTRYALLAGVAQADLTRRVDESIMALGIEEHSRKRARQLSKGNLQRLGLAQTLLADHELIVLDEPTHGLDPVWTQRFRDLVESLRRNDRVILIASHNLDELSRLADRVGIMDGGRLQRVVNVNAGNEPGEGATSYRIAVNGDDTRVAELVPSARALGRGEFEVTSITVEAMNAALVTLVQHGIVVRSMTPSHSALEQQFRDAVSPGRRRDD